MSHAAAQHLASYGRGGDTELVHMTKGEIKGLQALAMARGGSLTINPDTGLVEAGFLKRMLPMVAGAALTVGSGGALSPLAAALIVGGGYGVATGSITKGLMAGLGAYGGAGLGTSLGALGGEAAAEAVGTASTEGFKKVNEEAIKSGLSNQVMDASRGMVEPQLAQTLETAQNYITPQNFPGLTPEQISSSQAGLPEAIKSGSTPEQYMGSLGRASAAQTGTTASNISKGIGEVFSSPSAAGTFLKDNALTLGSALVPEFLNKEQKAPAGYTEDEYDRYLKGYRLSPNYQAYEAPRPNPYYSAQYASGGITSLQGGGGPVERMSMMNTAMNPQGGMYPQGMIDKTQYATPTQRPVSAELMSETPAYERSNPMLMAEGGIARYAPGGQINLQGTVNLNQGNMASQASPGAATVGSSMAPSTILPMSLPFMGMPATGGPGMGPQNHMYQPQLAVMPQQSMASGGIARYRNKGQVNVLQDYINRQEQQMSPLPESVGIPRTGIFRDTDVDTARKDALTAAMIRLGKASKGAGIKTVALPKTAIKGLGDISGATQDITEAAKGGMMSHLGGYSDGGRMLKGPGDGMSDSIPATIAGKQPARLADGEFVVPADVVSHLGNGSTDAGAKKLYGMMDKIRKARTGKKKQAPQVKAGKYLPA